jgi:hypothetical protein
MDIGKRIDGDIGIGKIRNRLSDESTRQVIYSLDIDVFTNFFNELYDVEEITLIIEESFGISI